MLKSRFPSFVLSIAMGLALFGGRPDTGSAQGTVVCRQCLEYQWNNEIGPPTNPGWKHTFRDIPCSGSFLGYSLVTIIHKKTGESASVLARRECSRCGGTSLCHYESLPWEAISDGTCHLACGPISLSELSETVLEIHEGLDTGDAEAVAAALRRERKGFSLKYDHAGGRIEVLLSCEAVRTWRTIPVLPGVRAELRARIDEGPAAAERTVSGPA